MAIAPGTKAPGFTLYNTERKAVSLNDFAGKLLVLNFFPAAFTGVCTEQLCSNRDDLSFYNDLGASVVGVSVDMPFSLGIFKQQQQVNFDLLSDFNKDMIRAYDMYLEDFTLGIKGVAKRGVVVIDENGTVIYSEETAHPGAQINFDQLKNALKAHKQ
jgi:peroxiredoxin